MVLIPIFVLAQKAPEGIGGLNWGDPIEKFKQLTNPSGFGLKDMGNDVKIGRRFISLGEVTYGNEPSMYSFYRDRFYSFAFPVNATQKHIAHKKYTVLRDSLKMKYGPPTEEKPLVLKINPNAPVGKVYIWKSGEVWIELEWNEMKYKGSLVYTYIPIMAESIRRDKESAEKTKDSL